MNEINSQLWQKAIEYHGHQCGGLALGFRLGQAARAIFGPQAEIYCRMPQRTCITDGIAVAIGAEEEEDRIVIDPSVKDYLFSVPDEEEGWALQLKKIDLARLEDPIAMILHCQKEFLFGMYPFDNDNN